MIKSDIIAQTDPIDLENRIVYLMGIKDELYY